MNQKYFLTEERLEELKKELQELKTTGRFEVAERLKRAKEYGDLSENSEYSEAKDDQGQLEAKIIELEDIIKNAEIIKMVSGSDVVEMGSTVNVKKNSSSQTIRYTIVGSKEVNPDKGKISNESPVGKALLKKKVGEKVSVETPAGKSIYQIVSIE